MDGFISPPAVTFAVTVALVFVGLAAALSWNALR